MFEILVNWQGGVAGIVEDWRKLVGENRERDGDKAGVFSADVLVNAGADGGVVVNAGAFAWDRTLAGNDADDVH